MKTLKGLFLIISLISLPLTSFAQDQGLYSRGEILEHFSGSNPDSKTRIKHDPLMHYLIDTVFPGGRSKQFLGNKKATSYKGSNIKVGETLAPSRYENSRLFLFAFSPDHVEFFQIYQQGLEDVSARRSITTFNKDEQLAFWLNLYNVIVINKLVQEYPVHNLSSLFDGTKGRSSFKNEKVTNVDNIPLSLREIEQILFHNYDSPLVAFGLWQGSIGGPRLPNFAYTSTNVWKTLEENAIEFVNSNRGMRPPRGSKLKVSKFYEWMMPAFGTSEDHILAFIKRYADPNFVSGMDRIRAINPSVYNWTISDLLQGNLHEGQWLQLGGLQQSHGGGRTAPPKVRGFYRTFRPNNVLKFIQSKTPTGPLTILPPTAIEYIQGIKANNQLPTPLVTSEECAPGEACEARPDEAK